MHWYTIENIDHIDTPCLVLYRDRIAFNIQQAIKIIKKVENLRPHVKTNKTPEVCKMMMDAGIKKFKCATIAEAEMLAMINASDVLFAYQPTGPKIERLRQLAIHYPDTIFSCLVDDIQTAAQISGTFSRLGLTLDVFIDVNTGMNRTGIEPSKAYDLIEGLKNLSGIHIKGLHIYDGHVKDPDPALREKKIIESFSEIKKLLIHLETKLHRKMTIVAGGSPTFPAHAKTNVECSPGTFVFWDWGYAHQLPDEPFEYAALVITRVVSVVDGTTITADLGHKAIASENPLPRVYFLNAPGSKPIAHSEEHIVIKVPDSSPYKPGTVLYGIPMHICPTVALYERAILVENKKATTIWKITGRDRMINF